MIFTSDEVTSENHWQITSWVTEKSLFTVTNVSFYFSHAILCPERIIPLKQPSSIHFSIVAKDGLFSLSIVTSPQLSHEREILALWRHIRRLFLHSQIDTKTIFASE